MDAGFLIKNVVSGLALRILEESLQTWKTRKKKKSEKKFAYPLIIIFNRLIPQGT